jgi:hypothetical protein
MCHREMVRLGVTLLLTGVLFASSALAAPAAFWPVPKLMRKLDGAALHVERRTIRVDTETTLCSGRGKAIRVGGERRWHLFHCTYTTFSPRGVDRDIDFRVWILDARRFRITNAAWVQDPR